MDFHKYSFSKLAFMLNVTSKSENETFLITRICEYTETWVVTQRDIKGHIKSHWSKQNNVIASFSFASTAVELSKSTGWDFESTIKFNASTGEEYILWMICLWCLWYQSGFRHRALWLHSFLSFFPETSKLQSAVYSEWNTSLLLNTLRKKNDLMK